MKRSMMQAYVVRSDEAVTLYQKAFGAVLISSFPNEDGTFFHSELDIQGEILAVAERSSENVTARDETQTGNVMQFCLHHVCLVLSWWISSTNMVFGGVYSYSVSLSS